MQEDSCFIWIVMPVSPDDQKENDVNNSHMSALRIKHADLESKLEREETRPLPDAKLILNLKKQKLQIKDVIAQETANA
jgi:uncharacterized protein